MWEGGVVGLTFKHSIIDLIGHKGDVVDLEWCLPNCLLSFWKWNCYSNLVGARLNLNSLKSNIMWGNIITRDCAFSYPKQVKVC